MMQKNKIEEIIAKDGVYVSTISGYSMSPMLKDRRDTVVVSAFSGELKKYDVALYRAGEKYVLHRIVKVLENEYIACGDNCVVLERVPKNTVIGKLTEVWRGNEKLDLDSKEYRAYCRRKVAEIYPRKAYRGTKKAIFSMARKILKKRR